MGGVAALLLAMAAPASGFSKVHEVEQRDIITKAFA